MLMLSVETACPKTILGGCGNGQEGGGGGGGPGKEERGRGEDQSEILLLARELTGVPCT